MAKIPVIIDTDPGVDDVLAILFALASPELEVLSIILTFGNTDIQSEYTNILKLYQAIQRQIEAHPEDKARWPGFNPSKTILAFGAEHPLAGDRHDARYFHGNDGLGNVSIRHPELNVDPHFCQGPLLSEKSGVEVVLDLIREHPERTISYLAVGPLTTLAQVMRADGQLVRDKIGRVISMGGAIDVPGNTTPVAEFNFFADPYAVEELLSPDPDKGIPLERFILLPLDITIHHKLWFMDYKEKIDPDFEHTSKPSDASKKSPIRHFTSSFLEKTREVTLSYGCDGTELHDITAVWCAIQNPPSQIEDTNGPPKTEQGWTVVQRHFEVERIGEKTRGMLVVDRRGDSSAYATGANRSHIYSELQKDRITHDLPESTAITAQVETEDQSGLKITRPLGVACVVETPGCQAFTDLIFERIWGYKLDQTVRS